MLAALYLWLESPADSAVGSRQSLAAALAEGWRNLSDADSGSSGEPSVDAPPPGSMQESLLNSSDGHRRQLFWRAITGAGFECVDVRVVGAVGGTGSAWRANCGDASIYLIEVNEFGRLAVTPMPYGDLYHPGVELEFEPREPIENRVPE